MEHRNGVGTLLREWRTRRGLSQLGLAVEANISQRHLSFLESGRSRPSRDMLLHLAEYLEVPLRERNTILIAGGYAPHYPQRPLDAPELSAARGAIDRILHGHLPHPALVVDRYWTLIAANSALDFLLDGVSAHLLQGDVNVLRVGLHPDGMAPRILNLSEWRAHILARLRHEADHTADPKLAALRDEIAALPVPYDANERRAMAPQTGHIAVPIRLASDAGPLSFISTTTIFGTAADVTLSEITIEAFYPADEKTAQIMARFNGAAR